MSRFECYLRHYYDVQKLGGEQECSRIEESNQKTEFKTPQKSQKKDARKLDLSPISITLGGNIIPSNPYSTNRNNTTEEDNGNNDNNENGIRSSRQSKLSI